MQRFMQCHQVEEESFEEISGKLFWKSQVSFLNDFPRLLIKKLSLDEMISTFLEFLRQKSLTNRMFSMSSSIALATSKLETAFCGASREKFCNPISLFLTSHFQFIICRVWSRTLAEFSATFCFVLLTLL